VAPGCTVTFTDTVVLAARVQLVAIIQLPVVGGDGHELLVDWLTVCVRTDDVLAASFVSPRYLVTIPCDPTDNVDVEYVALPPDIVPVPSVVGGDVLVSLNCTVPVAVFGDTVAVKVTD
jgi:hypothetical protein